MSRRHPYHALADAELTAWPGVTAERGRKTAHLTLTLRYAGRSRFVVYPDSPSDHRGPLNHVRDIRRTLTALGAERSATTAARQLEPA